METNEQPTPGTPEIGPDVRRIMGDGMNIAKDARKKIFTATGISMMATADERAIGDTPEKRKENGSKMKAVTAIALGAADTYEIDPFQLISIADTLLSIGIAGLVRYGVKGGGAFDINKVLAGAEKDNPDASLSAERYEQLHPEDVKLVPKRKDV